MVKFWTWNGNKLAHPLTIARRLLMFPIILALRSALFLAVWAGWGFDEAQDLWRMSA